MEHRWSRGKHLKYLVRNWVRALSPIPLIVGLQELKIAHFLTSIALNIIQLDYQHVISLLFEGKEELLSSITP